MAIKAIAVQARGEPMPLACETCKDAKHGEFDSCRSQRNQSRNACANCIASGCERLCEWRTQRNLDSDTEHDYRVPTPRAKKRRAQDTRAAEHAASPKRRKHKEREAQDARRRRYSTNVVLVDSTAEDDD